MRHFCIEIAAALTLAALVFPGAASAANPYALPSGTRLEYQTSATFVASGEKPQSQDAEISTTYTVLAESGQARTIFAAADLNKYMVGGKAQKERTSTRFNFEITPDGAMSERVVGIYRPVFPGWHPSINFPEIPASSEETTITVELPMLNQGVPATAKVEKKGEDSILTVKFAPEDPDTGKPGMVEYTAQYTYSAKEKAISTARVEFRVAPEQENGKKMQLNLLLESNLKGVTKVPDASFSALKEDVAAGIKLLDEMQNGMRGQAKGETDTLKMLDPYLVKYPKGEFAETFNTVKVQAGLMAELRENAQALEEGKPAPEFEAKGVDGSTVKLSDYKGKIVLVDFWATWCGPCIQEMPKLKQLYAENKAAGFEIVGISADNDEADLRKFLDAEKLEWKQIYEGEPKKGNVQYQYGVMRYPSSVLVGRDGKVLRVNARGDMLEDAVSEALGGAKKSESSTSKTTSTAKD